MSQADQPPDKRALTTARGHVLAAAAFMTMPIAVFAPVQLTGLLILAAIGSVLTARNRRALLSPPARQILWSLGALCLWAAASTVWAIDTRLAVIETLRFTGTVFAGILVFGAATTIGASERTRVCRALLYGSVIGYALLAFEIATEGLILSTVSAWITSGAKPFIFSVAYNRATSVIAMVSWPMILIGLRRRAPLAAAALFLAGLAFVVELEKHASTITLILGAAALALVWIAGRRIMIAIAAIIAIAIMIAPSLPSTILDPVRVARHYPQVSFSEFHRLVIWKFVAERIGERPLAGWGMNSSRVIPGGKTLVSTDIPELRASSGGAGGHMVEQLPLHPHNAPLQLWLELGGVGAFLGGAFVVGALLICRRHAASRLDAAVATAAIVSAVSISAMSFSIWQSWWLAVIWLTASFMVCARTNPAAMPARPNPIPHP